MLIPPRENLPRIVVSGVFEVWTLLTKLFRRFFIREVSVVKVYLVCVLKHLHKTKKMYFRPTSHLTCCTLHGAHISTKIECVIKEDKPVIEWPTCVYVSMRFLLAQFIYILAVRHPSHLIKVNKLLHFSLLEITTHAGSFVPENTSGKRYSFYISWLQSFCALT